MFEVLMRLIPRCSYLWRGSRDRVVDEKFLSLGGTEVCSPIRNPTVTRQPAAKENPPNDEDDG
jgi:hypothetical protein